MIDPRANTSWLTLSTDTLPESVSAVVNASNTCHSKIFSLTERQAEFRPKCSLSAAAIFMYPWHSLCPIKVRCYFLKIQNGWFCNKWEVKNKNENNNNWRKISTRISRENQMSVRLLWIYRWFHLISPILSPGNLGMWNRVFISTSTECHKKLCCPGDPVLQHLSDCGWGA